MKKLQSAFGMILMFFGGIGAVSFFLSFFRMVISGDIDLPPLGRFALWAVMLAFAAGVCWLGRRLYVKGGKSIRFSAKKADKREKTRETPKRAKPAKKPAAQENDPVFDVTVDGSFVFYLDDKAREKAWYEYETPVIRKIYAEVREGVPAVSCEGYLHHEIGNGREWIEDTAETLEIPPETVAGLTPEKLKAWLETQGKRWPVPWDVPAFHRSAALWCAIARQQALMQHNTPEGAYAVRNPFYWVDEVGPDGLYDESGIGCWLRLKEGAKPKDVLDALAERPRNNAAVLLLGENEQTGYLSQADRQRYSDRKVWAGQVTGDGEGIKDLVSEREYRVHTQEWPGSADDAATYGRWWLTKEPPASEKAVCQAMIRQIVGDCRALGIDEERIREGVFGALRGEELAWDSQRGYQLLDHDRGNVNCLFAETDGKEFRFRFLRDFVYRCFSTQGSRKAAVETMLCETEERFGDTAGYDALRKTYEDNNQNLTNPRRFVLSRWVFREENRESDAAFFEGKRVEVSIVHNAWCEPYLRVRTVTCSTEANGRPVTTVQDDAYPVENPYVINEHNWKEYMKEDEKIILCRESFEGVPEDDPVQKKKQPAAGAPKKAQQ